MTKVSSATAAPAANSVSVGSAVESKDSKVTMGIFAKTAGVASSGWNGTISGVKYVGGLVQALAEKIANFVNNYFIQPLKNGCHFVVDTISAKLGGYHYKPLLALAQNEIDNLKGGKLVESSWWNIFG